MVWRLTLVVGDEYLFMTSSSSSGMDDLIFEASLLHVSQASVDLSKVLLHLVHALGKVDSKGLKPLHFCGHGIMGQSNL